MDALLGRKREADSASTPADSGVLRILTCGTVDDGKSTLVGRLLVDLNCVPKDRLASLERESRRVGRNPGGLDYALLLDGLEAEVEQGITIDVAYRYFGTSRRAFVVADAPGHEQYTRNMATAASVSDFALLLVDARNGITTQTRRHSWIAARFGIRHVALAVNKCDLVGYSEAVFSDIAGSYRELADSLGFVSVQAIPVSALCGDNVSQPSARTPWYDGPSLLKHLESVEVERERAGGPLRLPVQWVCRPDSSFRGFAGTIESGRVRKGDAVTVAASGAASRIGRILIGERDVADSEPCCNP
jgi:bifunctional enzyme CysN/CysC